VVIADLNIRRTNVRPDEADPVLVVDADAALPSSVAVQSLETIGRRHLEVFKPGGGIEHDQLSHRDTLNGLEVPDPLTHKQAAGSNAAERDDGHEDLLRKNATAIR